MDKNTDEKEIKNLKKNNNIVVNNSKNIKIKINEKDGKNYIDKIIERNNASPNHKRVDIVETRKNNKNNIDINRINNIKNINVKFSHDFGNIKNENINSRQNKEENNNKSLYKSINFGNSKQMISEKLQLIENKIKEKDNEKEKEIK